MSDLDLFAGRAGRLDCACPPQAGAAGKGLLRLALGFGLNILAQALTIAALPLASASAPSPLRGAPYALLLLGAALASFPASFLLDAFGRRGAFALGAGLGVAGGLLSAWASYQQNFTLLSLGAFWLGLSNGFALFYRHAAAAGTAGVKGAMVLGGGVLAALTAPLLMAMAMTRGGQWADAVSLMLAGVVNFLGLALAVTLPHALAPLANDPRAQPISILTPTAFGALAWFCMAAMMARASPDLVSCGANAASAGGIIAWHLLAMYAPAALLMIVTPKYSPPWGLVMGFSLLGAGFAIFIGARNPTTIAWAMILAGVGWSVANGALMMKLHAGSVSRRALATHDFCLLSAAMAGALAGPYVSRVL